MAQPFTPTWHQPAPTAEPPRDPPPGWTAAPVAAEQQRRIRFEVLTMLLLAAVPSFIIGLEGIGDPTSISTDIGVLELLAMVAAAAGPAAMAAHLLWRDGRLRVAGFSRRRFGFVAGYGLLGVVCCYLALIGAAIVFWSVYLAVGGDPDRLQDGEAPDVALSVGSLVIGYVIAITAGITEEVVFRAYAITRLEELGWKRAAYVVPAVLFTSLHLYQGIFALALIGAVAVIFTWLYRWKRSIWPVMVAHALFDAGQLTLAALTR